MFDATDNCLEANFSDKNKPKMTDKYVCTIPHVVLNRDLKFPVCTRVYAKV